MKLEGVLEGALIVTTGRKLYSRTDEERLDRIGELPNPYSRLEGVRYNVKTGGTTAKLRRLITGRVHSVNVWPVDEDVFLANATDHLFRSCDGGQTWNLIKRLHLSSGIRGVLPRGLCYHGGTIYLGEYIFDEDRSPRVFASDDLGESWRTELVLDGVRHVHAVQPDPYTGDCWIATGDRDSESKIGRLTDGRLEVLGTGSQRWRAVELVFTPDAILWGTDCPYQENHVLRVSRDEIGGNPEPELLHRVDDPFYYSTSVEIDGEMIVLFSTGGGYETDSTAPDAETRTTPDARRLGVYGSTLATDFSEWHTLATYEVEKRLLNRIGRHALTANGYVFLESSPERGVFVNPINTKTDDGKILNVDPETLVSNDLQSAFSGI